MHAGGTLTARRYSDMLVASSGMVNHVINITSDVTYNHQLRKDAHEPCTYALGSQVTVTQNYARGAAPC
jgi:hypothetical protein